MKITRILIYAAFPLIYVINMFFDLKIFNILIFILACFALILSFSKARRFYTLMGAIFLFIGLLLFFVSDTPSGILSEAFHPMIGVIGFLLVLPFIQAIIRIGTYDVSLYQFLQHRVKTLHELYGRASIGVYILSIFLAIAAIPVSAQSFGKRITALKGEARKRFISNFLSRSYGFGWTSSPVEMAVLIVLDGTNANILIVFSIFMVISAVLLFVEWYAQKRHYQHIPLENSEEETVSFPKDDFVKTIQFIVAIVVFLLSVLLVNTILDKGIVIAIIFILFPFCFLWSLFIRKPKEFLQEVRSVWPQSAENMSDFNMLFLSAGFFVTMVQASPLLDLLNELLVSQFHYLPVIVFCLFISLLLWLLTYLGVQLLVLLALFASILQPIFAGHENALAILLIGVSMPLILINPFSVNTNILASVLRVHVATFIRWNLGFALRYILLINIIVFLLML